MPCEELVQESYACDLMVHEATFDDSLHEEARLRKHCTVSQAIEICKRTHAKYSILTHFSQRYPKYPEVQSEKNIAIAFDGMMFTLQNMESNNQNLLLLKEYFEAQA